MDGRTHDRKASTNKTDICAYGLVLEEIANSDWAANLEDEFQKTLLGARKASTRDVIPLRRKSVQSDYYEDVITPKILEVSEQSVTAFVITFRTKPVGCCT